MSNISFGNPRKTEAIYQKLIELSTGTNIMNKLKADGFLEEYNDPEEKRAKRVKLTTKEEKSMVACRERRQKSQFFFLKT